MSFEYTVQLGDTLSQIAREHGFEHWREIYDSDENQAFRSLRPDPSLIQPNDVLIIPEKNEEDDDEMAAELEALEDDDLDELDEDFHDTEIADQYEELPAAFDLPEADEVPDHRVARQNWNLIDTRPTGFPWFSA